MHHNSRTPTSTPLSPADSALARSRLYDLLSQLYQSGLRPELLPVVQAITEFEAALPNNLDASELAATHQRIFGLALFAHESIFLDASGMLGGSIAETVMARYAQLGYHPNVTTADGDQLGAELGVLSFLCRAEAEAWVDNVEAEAMRMRQTQMRFLQEHLLRWLSPCLWAIQLEGEPFYSAVTEVTWELVSDHYGEFSNGGLSNGELSNGELINRGLINEEMATAPITGFALSESPDLLANPETSLRDIAEYLMTPCYSGLFISRTTVGQLGRELQLPRGFTDRTTMLVNLMQSAAQYDGTLPLLDKLTEHFQEAKNYYTAHSNDATQFALQPWIQATTRTITLLTTIKTSAQDLLATAENSPAD